MAVSDLLVLSASVINGSPVDKYTLLKCHSAFQGFEGSLRGHVNNAWWVRTRYAASTMHGHAMIQYVCRDVCLGKVFHEVIVTLCAV